MFEGKKEELKKKQRDKELKKEVENNIKGVDWILNREAFTVYSPFMQEVELVSKERVGESEEGWIVKPAKRVGKTRDGRSKMTEIGWQVEDFGRLGWDVNRVDIVDPESRSGGEQSRVAHIQYLRCCCIGRWRWSRLGLFHLADTSSGGPSPWFHQCPHTSPCDQRHKPRGGFPFPLASRFCPLGIEPRNQ